EALKPEEARPNPILTGNDLIDLGYTPGPEFKKILTALEDAQLENQITDRKSAVDYLQLKFPPGS
ncbi:MAG: CCA tRNA nucleotidyltransferase, partial [Terriglobia bacterium]